MRVHQHKRLNVQYMQHFKAQVVCCIPKSRKQWKLKNTSIIYVLCRWEYWCYPKKKIPHTQKSCWVHFANRLNASNITNYDMKFQQAALLFPFFFLFFLFGYNSLVYALPILGCIEPMLLPTFPARLWLHLSPIKT